MRARRSVLGLLFGLTALGWMVIAVPPLAEGQAPKRGGTLRVSYGDEIAHLDFHTAPGYEMMDPAKRKGVAKELQEYMADKLYFNVISGSPFYMVAQPWVKDYVYNAEFEVHWDTVWLDK